MGKSSKADCVRDEMKCADAYMGDPGFAGSQMPSASLWRSRMSNGIPACTNARAVASPEGPAPMMQNFSLVGCMGGQRPFAARARSAGTKLCGCGGWLEGECGCALAAPPAVRYHRATTHNGD